MKSKQTPWFLATLLVAGLLGASVTTARKNDEAEVVLQAAIHKQLVDGDLEAAIQLYKKILANHSGDRAIAAKALVEMGRCYEKLGKTEARKAYERVLREYADQNEAASQARTRLAALSGGAKTTEMVTRRVWTGPDVDTLGAPSPDGRYLSYVDWETGDLAVRDLSTGEKRRLTNKGSWNESTEFALFSKPSPDGKQVAYSWFNRDNFFDLRIVGLDGSKPRVLYRNEEVEEPDPAEWSPDGKQILATFHRKDRTKQIVLVTVADGSVRVLKTLDWRFPVKMSFSPDGRYIAYDFPPNEDSPNRDIFALATDGSREIPLVEHPANDLLLGWAQDGQRVLFSSDRTGTLGAWVVQVADGKPQGSPELVKPDIGRIWALGFTRKGAFYYGPQTGSNDIYIASLDSATGKLLAAPTPATQRFMGSNTSPDWSPDGQYLAYISQRGPVPAGGLGSAVISIRSVETSEERELSPKSNYLIQLRWSPEGRSVLVVGNDKKNRQGLYRIDAQTADVTPIVQSEPGSYISHPAWSPDGKMIFYLRSDAKSHRIVLRDLATGQEKELYHTVSPSDIRGVAVSPDGRQLAFTMRDEPTRSMALKVMAITGGEPRELLRVKEPELIQYGSVEWTRDARKILFARGRSTPQEPKASLWQVPASGGEPERVDLTMDWMRDLRLHPDGRRLAFTAGLNTAEVWVMENFLPVLKAGR